ncbi:hypothetical protein CYMTET_26884 [Cymbomonas tetramitiformis]|uniref:HEAT repeat domain-containing protein n=1 Tax=Cymbomonas tetramitiformis TaxID=36881 RepID=A0AAE0FRJ2_9CHLO|nr:hypothetical protein CYMTET_26884 [Cymbomonas tetramitiformis]
MGLSHGDMAAVCCVSRRWRQEAGPGAAAIRALAGPTRNNTTHEAGAEARRDARVRQAALESLREHAAPYAGAVVATQLEHANEGVSWAAVEALGRLGEHAARNARAIVARLLEHADAVEALESLGEHATRNAWAIAAQLEDGDAGAVMEALGRLAEHLEDADEMREERALWRLVEVAALRCRGNRGTGRKMPIKR